MPDFVQIARIVSNRRSMVRVETRSFLAISAIVHD
jgi:hypothetical protein